MDINDCIIKQIKAIIRERWRTLGLLIVLLLTSVFAGWLAFTMMRNWTISNYPVTIQSNSFIPVNGSTPQATPEQIQATSTPLASLPEPTLTPWDGVGQGYDPALRTGLPGLGSWQRVFPKRYHDIVDA